jgi:hypothetical protein
MDDRSGVQKHPKEEHSIRDGLNDRKEENIVLRLQPHQGLKAKTCQAHTLASLFIPRHLLAQMGPK